MGDGEHGTASSSTAYVVRVLFSTRMLAASFSHAPNREKNIDMGGLGCWRHCFPYIHPPSSSRSSLYVFRASDFLA